MSQIIELQTDIVIDASVCIGANIWQLRNKGVNKGLSQLKKQVVDCDYYLSTDWDIRYSLSHIMRLISHNLPIVSGVYRRKDNPNLIHAGYWDPPGVKSESLKVNDSGLKKVNWVGGGFLLVSKEALEKMEYPWWRSEIISYDESQEATSADFGFCLNAMRHNIPIHVDCMCEVEHKHI